jgi:crotonobetainyl-CoA:carnitine CoA-transferase CaiB-like acyl-CoA transferase
MSCVEAGVTMLGPSVLDWTVNGRPSRRPGQPDSNHSRQPAMSPHNIYRASGEDEWVALACRDDADWAALARTIREPWAEEPRWASAEGRLGEQSELDERITAWTQERGKFQVQDELQAAGVPAAAVQRPEERIERDVGTTEWGLWPEVAHPEIGPIRVDGIPVHLSDTDWQIGRGAPLLGEHNAYVFGELLALPADELAALSEEGVI